MTFQIASADDVIDLRHAVLREGLPRASAIFPGDEAPDARHYTATAHGHVVGCATFHLNEWEGEPGWQLRGMATETTFRSQGVGRKLLSFAEADLIRVGPVRRLWCNARVPASRFYRSLGWEICSDVFDIPTAGPHYRMTRVIPG